MEYDSLFDYLRNMNLEMERHFYRLFSPKHPCQSLPEEKWQPYTDVYETKDGFVVKMELAGVKKKDMSVRIHGNQLVVMGTRRDSPRGEKRVYHQVEINYSEFERIVILPKTVNDEAVKAMYKDGFLIVTVSKVTGETQKRALEIAVE